MARGDIYLVSLDPTRGHEQQGRCPVLVVSPGAFNWLTKVPIVVPITSGGNFARTAGFAVSLMGASTRTRGVVRCDRPRALDLGSRCGRKLETVPSAVTDEVLARFAPLFDRWVEAAGGSRTSPLSAVSPRSSPPMLPGGASMRS
jgi:mRNA-degrading endonuclease toxin of MazEF toxin-antitoxin module